MDKILKQPALAERSRRINMVIGCSVFLIISILLLGQLWIWMKTNRGVEGTLNGIIEGEQCYVFETITISGSNSIQTISKVQCKWSGVHELFISGLPRNFTKEDGEIVSIPLDTY